MLATQRRETHTHASSLERYLQGRIGNPCDRAGSRQTGHLQYDRDQAMRGGGARRRPARNVLIAQNTEMKKC